MANYNPRLKVIRKIRKKMRKGDRLYAAKRAECSPRTVDDALKGLQGEKRDDALDELLNIINEREEKLKQKIDKL